MRGKSDKKSPPAKAGKAKDAKVGKNAKKAKKAERRTVSLPAKPLQQRKGKAAVKATAGKHKATPAKPKPAKAKPVKAQPPKAPPSKPARTAKPGPTAKGRNALAAGKSAAAKPAVVAAKAAAKPAPQRAAAAAKPEKPAAPAAIKPKKPAAPVAIKPKKPTAPVAIKPEKPAAPVAIKPEKPAAPVAIKPEKPAAPVAIKPEKPAAPVASKPEKPAAANGRPPVPDKPAPRPSAVEAPPSKLPLRKRIEFSVGDFVVYPTHGVGKIVAIEEQEIAGYRLELLVVDFYKEKMTLRVPVAKASITGMRRLSSPDTMRSALQTLKGRARVKRTMWSRRAQEYEAKINSGDPISIAEVVRDLHRASGQPEQSYSERQIYEAALDRLARELAAVEGLDDQAATEQLEKLLRAA